MRSLHTPLFPSSTQLPLSICLFPSSTQLPLSICSSLMSTARVPPQSVVLLLSARPRP